MNFCVKYNFKICMYLNVSVKYLIVKNLFLYYCYVYYDENSCVNISLKVCIFVIMYRFGIFEEDEWLMELFLYLDFFDFVSNVLFIICEFDINLIIILWLSYNF